MTIPDTPESTRAAGQNGKGSGRRRESPQKIRENWPFEKLFMCSNLCGQRECMHMFPHYRDTTCDDDCIEYHP